LGNLIKGTKDWKRQEETHDEELATGRPLKRSKSSFSSKQQRELRASITDDDTYNAGRAKKVTTGRSIKEFKSSFSSKQQRKRRTSGANDGTDNSDTTEGYNDNDSDNRDKELGKLIDEANVRKRREERHGKPVATGKSFKQFNDYWRVQNQELGTYVTDDDTDNSDPTNGYNDNDKDKGLGTLIEGTRERKRREERPGEKVATGRSFKQFNDYWLVKN